MANHERRVTLVMLVTGLPALALGLVLLWTGDFAARTQWTLTIIVTLVFVGGIASLRERVVRPIQTISNMIAAIREQD